MGLVRREASRHNPIRPRMETAASTKVTGEGRVGRDGHMASAQADCITAERIIRRAGSFQS